ncbi:carbohydrate ABC transporter permease [Marinomonas sp. IMCC 4694]|uniref:carbohydrate ABC transporter permease n=1 Tax=Marinomonas sp. IMCC 4694 TaxID=2605432 RepID=UPI0011E66BD7|nr:carbohydrate ABC transporter permease [Marinomonas sp. IMCC 4694]TYL46963.1 carbohydrate ABC transporter permease [Marinomonas sp. IMCC 4694]
MTKLTGPQGPKPSRNSTSRYGVYGFLIIAAIFFCIPLYIMVVTSLKGMPEIRLGDLFALPGDPSFAAWTKAWSEACTGVQCDGIQGGFWNSIKISVPSVAISIAIGAINGYALSFWRFKGANVLFGVLLFGAFVPFQVVIFPIIIFFREIGIYGSLLGIILVHTAFGMPIMTLLFRNYFSSLPEELFKAARVDGAGFWQIFFQIMMPLAIPVTVVAVILQTTGIWNDYLLGLIFAGRENLPMTVQLNNIVSATFGVREYNVNMAATILTAMVPLAIYLFSGKYFVRGIAAGAVKG